MSRHSEDTSTLIKTDNILSALDSMLGILQADKQELYYSDSVVANERDNGKDFGVQVRCRFSRSTSDEKYQPGYFDSRVPSSAVDRFYDM